MSLLYHFLLLLLPLICLAQTPNTSETNQPNCLAGAFAMLSMEALNTRTEARFWETNMSVPDMEHASLLWDKTFPQTPLQIIYDVTDTNFEGDGIVFGRPYIWVGLFQGGWHSCLVYFDATNTVLKHFVLDPSTGTNYSITMDYPQFFSNTASIYEVAQATLKTIPRSK